jgi:hypothetical protein
MSQKPHCTIAVTSFNFGSLPFFNCLLTRHGVKGRCPGTVLRTPNQGT